MAGPPRRTPRGPRGLSIPGAEVAMTYVSSPPPSGVNPKNVVSEDEAIDTNTEFVYRALNGVS